MEPLARVPEPELMDDPDQAEAYAEADFSESNQRFVNETTTRFPELRDGAGTLVDVGCGPGDVTVRLARACPRWAVVGVDGARRMLDRAGDLVTRSALAQRIRLEQRMLPSAELLTRRFDALASNSLLHHLADPGTLWAIARRCLPAGAPIAVMDLRRPDAETEIDVIVARYAPGAPEVLTTDFRNSLRAAYRPEEVVAQLAMAGLGHLHVEMITDRHLLVTGRR